MIMNIGFSYIIKNTILPDCVYVGHIKKHVKVRFPAHIVNAYSNKKQKKYAKLYDFMRKLDANDFYYEILEKIEYLKKIEIRMREDISMQKYNSIEKG